MLPAIALCATLFASAPAATPPTLLHWKPLQGDGRNGKAREEFQRRVELSLERSKNLPSLPDTVASWVERADSLWKLEIVLSSTFPFVQGMECDTLRDAVWNRALTRMAKSQPLQVRRDAFQNSQWGRTRPNIDLTPRSIRPGKPVQLRTNGWMAYHFDKLDSLPVELAKLEGRLMDSLRTKVVDTVWARRMPDSRAFWMLDSLPSAGMWRLSLATDDAISDKFCVVSRLDGAVVRDAGRMVLWGSSQDTDMVGPYQVLVRLPDGSWIQDSTDARGIKEFAIDGARTEPLEIFLRKGEQFAVLWSPYLQVDHQGSLQRATLWTDRPVYRPGDSVHVSGFVLERDLQGMLVQVHPDSLLLEIRSWAGGGRRTRWLRSNRSGMFSGSFRLAPDERQGVVEVSVPSVSPSGRTLARSSASFEVQAYRRAEFEVRLSTPNARVLRGDSVRLQVLAKDWSGAPLANAKLRLEYRRYRDAIRGYLAGMESSRDTSLLLDSQGSALVLFPALDKSSSATKIVRIHAVVEDDSRRMDSATLLVPVWDGNLWIDAKFLSKSCTVGRSTPVEAKVTDRDGLPMVGDLRSMHLVGLDTVQDSLLRTDSAGRCTLLVVPRQGHPQNLILSASKTGTVPWSTRSVSFPPLEKDAAEAEFTLDRKAAEVGDTIRLSARGLPPFRRVWLVSEGRRLDTHYVARTDDQGRWSARLRVGPPLRPRGRIRIHFGESGGMERLCQELTVREPRRMLRGTIQVDPVVHHADTLVARIRIRDMEGKAVQGVFDFAVVDDALWKMVSPLEWWFRPEKTYPLLESDLALDGEGTASGRSGWSENHVFQLGAASPTMRLRGPVGLLPKRCDPQGKQENEQWLWKHRMREGRPPPGARSEGERPSGAGETSLETEGDRGMCRVFLPAIQGGKPTRGLDQTGPMDYFEPASLFKGLREVAFRSASVPTDTAGEAVVKVVLPDDQTRWRMVLRGADGSGRLVEVQEYVQKDR